MKYYAKTVTMSYKDIKKKEKKEKKRKPVVRVISVFDMLFGKQG